MAVALTSGNYLTIGLKAAGGTNIGLNSIQVLTRPAGNGAGLVARMLWTHYSYLTSCSFRFRGTRFRVRSWYRRCCALVADDSPVRLGYINNFLDLAFSTGIDCDWWASALTDDGQD
jgi:hypothetical protein